MLYALATIMIIMAVGGLLIMVAAGTHGVLTSIIQYMINSRNMVCKRCGEAMSAVTQRTEPKHRRSTDGTP